MQRHLHFTAIVSRQTAASVHGFGRQRRDSWEHEPEETSEAGQGLAPALPGFALAAQKLVDGVHEVRAQNLGQIRAVQLASERKGCARHRLCAQHHMRGQNKTRRQATSGDVL
eukprot:3867000-Rhodomonas_salina.2